MLKKHTLFVQFFVMKLPHATIIKTCLSAALFVSSSTLAANIDNDDELFAATTGAQFYGPAKYEFLTKSLKIYFKQKYQ